MRAFSTTTKKFSKLKVFLSKKKKHLKKLFEKSERCLFSSTMIFFGLWTRKKNYLRRIRIRFIEYIVLIFYMIDVLYTLLKNRLFYNFTKNIFSFRCFFE